VPTGVGLQPHFSLFMRGAGRYGSLFSLLFKNQSEAHWFDSEADFSALAFSVHICDANSAK